MEYEYKTEEPLIEHDMFFDGYDCVTVKTKSLFGKEKTKTKYVEKYISEKEWLDRLDKEGWKFINVLRNSMSYDLNTYYFKREIK